MENQIKIKDILISKLNSKISRIKLKLDEYKKMNQKLLVTIKNFNLSQKDGNLNFDSVK